MKLTAERELELLNELLAGKSVTSIVKEKHTSGRVLERIRRENGMWGN
jgi:hypothetical protein